MVLATPSLADQAIADLESMVDSEIAWHTEQGQGPCRGCITNLELLEELTREIDDLVMAHIESCAACTSKPWACPEYLRLVGIDPTGAASTTTEGRHA